MPLERRDADPLRKEAHLLKCQQKWKRDETKEKSSSIAEMTQRKKSYKKILANIIEQTKGISGKQFCKHLSDSEEHPQEEIQLNTAAWQSSSAYIYVYFSPSTLRKS